MRRRPSRRGHATIELLLIGSLLALALFAGEPPVAEQLASAVRALFLSLTYALSLP